MKASGSKPTITRNRRSNAAIKEDNDKMLRDLNLAPDTPITPAIIRKSKEFGAKKRSTSTSIPPSKAPSKTQLPSLPAPPLSTPQRVNYTTFRKKKEDEETISKNPVVLLDNIDLAFLIDHLSQPANHAKLLASGPKTNVGGLSRGAEWNVLACTVNNMHNDRLGLTNTCSPSKLNMDVPQHKTQTKKARQAHQSLAKRPAKPLPALNANEVKKKKTIDNALKQSSLERMQYFDKQMQLASEKQDQRANAASTSAAEALEFKQKKWDLQLEREDKKIASESARLLQITQLNNENEERKARREAIERCHKENMPMEEMKEYIAFLFPTSDKA
ncbi:hypothetical protein DFH28DRAFT_1095773 [Melampsora americana]|nr:hypothetical protein DFH28DRAFT_1095773 [Melampsora americana]